MVLIDNKKETLFQKLEKDLEEGGEFSFVSGFYSVFAFFKLLPKLKDLKSLKMILGRNVNTDGDKKVESVIISGQDIERIPQVEKNLSFDDQVDVFADFENLENSELIRFLKSEKVEIKTFERFCHTKLYLYESSAEKDRHSFFSLGSSNFTGSGLGIIKNSNLELNFVQHGSLESSDGHDAKKWFENLWEDKNCKDSKENTIKEILKYYKEFSPKEIYNLILWKLFKKQIVKNIELEKQNGGIKSLENSIIWKKLFDFQAFGARELIIKLEEYGVGFLADGVGLGKTWQALAVVKYFQNKGSRILILSPAKLKFHWEKYLSNISEENPFFEDYFNYQVKSHNFLDKEENIPRVENYDLIVIDESHNFRNVGTKKYQNLLEALKRKVKTKILFLTATPINNGIKDMFNQVALGFARNDQKENLEKLGFENLNNVQTLFREVSRKINNSNEENNRKNNQVVSSKPVSREINNSNKENKDFQLPTKFLEFIDEISVSRTRETIQKFFKNKNNEDFKFPENESIQKESTDFGNFADLIKKLDFAMYLPSQFKKENYDTDENGQLKLKIKTEISKNDSFNDQVRREHWLAKLMQMILIKRLESSIFAFKETVLKMKNYAEKIENDRINFLKQEKLNLIDLGEEESEDLEEEDKEKLEETLTEFKVGKKLEIKFSDLKEDYFKFVSKDKKVFDEILNKVEEVLKIGDRKSEDLEETIKGILKEKPKAKILIFSAYADTITNLFERLKNKFYGKVCGIVTARNANEIERTLQKFSPKSKLWNEMSNKEKENFNKNYETFLNSKKEKGFSEIDILFATDCVSEGQNLQDASVVINYDLHWNPVRLIQRNGRIDRIGSENEKIKTINYWPCEEFEEILGLQKILDEKLREMATMTGMDLSRIYPNNDVERTQRELIDLREARLMEKYKKKEINILDLEKQGFGFDDASLDTFRQEIFDHYKELKNKSIYLDSFPNGVYSGTSKSFFSKNSLFSNSQITNFDKTGVAFLLENVEETTEKEREVREKINQRYPYYLYFVDFDGNIVFNHLENLPKTLEVLKSFSEFERSVPEELKPIQKLEKYKEMINNIVKNVTNDPNYGKDGNYYEYTEPNLSNFQIVAWFILSE